MNIQSAVVLVTSAGSNLGETLAAHFCSLGATVVLCDQNKSKLAYAYQRCCNISEQVSSFHLPNYNQAAIEQLFDFVHTQHHTSPNVLVNNWPVYSMPSLLDDYSPDVLTQTMTLMASTLFNFGHATAERMRQDNKKGVIVNVISLEACQDLSGLDNVVSLVSGFTQSWAKELTPFNIRVGGVVPSVSPTSGSDPLHWAYIQDELIRNTEYIVSNDYFSGRIMSAKI